MERNENLAVHRQEVFTMSICLATETAPSELSPILLNAVIAIVALVIGWSLKVLSDRMSQKALFDHRLRLEKEYGLYSDLWDKLFELRRAVGQLVKPLGTSGEPCAARQILDLFNVYQAAVRKGEPFMSASIFDPAREIATVARRIIDNVGNQRSLEERREKGLNSRTDEKCVTEQIRLDDENETAFKEIEVLFQRVAQAIRLRVTP
jgi:hypothetical protein